MIKNIFYLVFFLLSLEISSQEEIVSSKSWQEDLLFLQNTVNNNYSFLFKKINKDSWNSHVDSLYNEIPSLSDHEIILGLTKIVSLFKYGHTRIDINNASVVIDDPVKFHQIPINLYYFKDGIYIEGASNKYKKLIGAKVKMIEGKEVEEVIRLINPIIPAENSQFSKAELPMYMRIPEVLHSQRIINEYKEEINYNLELDGKTFNQKFISTIEQKLPIKFGLVDNYEGWSNGLNTNTLPIYLKNKNKNYSFEYITKNKVIYIQQNKMKNEKSSDAESITEFYNRVSDFIESNDIDRLILDLRFNGGGSSSNIIPIIRTIIKSNKIDQLGKLYVIIGRRTFSASQNLVNELKKYTNAVFVGEPTAANINFYGDTNRIELPNSKISVFLSFAWWQSQPEWRDGPWVAPELFIQSTYGEYSLGIDPILEKAINYPEDGFGINPENYIKNAITNSGIEKFNGEFKKIYEDDTYKFIDFERTLNRVGYDLLIKNLALAINIFELNTEYFPKSSNAWNSLGEVYIKANNKQEATKALVNSIKFDPNGRIGKYSQKLLDQINNN